MGERGGDAPPGGRGAAVPADLAERLALAWELWEWEPHAGQREFLSLRLADGKEPGVLVAACGRRWGKTECLGMDVAARILLDPDLGQMGVAPTRDQAEALFDSVEEKIVGAREAAAEDAALAARFPHLADLEVKRAPYPQVRRKSDGRMVFWVRSAGRDGRNLRGRGTTRRLKRFRVIVDERAYVSDEAVEAAILPMLATVKGGGQLVQISSPNGKRGRFYEDYVKGERQTGRYRSVRLPSSQNPLVDSDYLREMAEEMTPTRFRAEFLAEFVESAGAVFPDADIEAATCDDDYGDAPLWGRRYVAGIDFGRRGDYTVVSVLDVGPLAARLVAWKRFQGLTWAGQIEEICRVVQHWGVCAVVGDATGIGDALCEQLAAAAAAKRLPVAVEPFVFTWAGKTAIIDATVLALSQRRLRFPAHPVLLGELRNFEAIPAATPTGRERLEAAKGHDDAVCSLALAVHAAAPWLVKGAAPVAVATGGRRITTDEEKFSAWSAEHSVASAGGRSQSEALTYRASWERVGRRWRMRAIWRLTGSAYRCEAGRRAGAYLARLTRRRARSTRGAG